MIVQGEGRGGVAARTQGEIFSNQAAVAEGAPAQQAAMNHLRCHWNHSCNEVPLISSYYIERRLSQRRPSATHRIRHPFPQTLTPHSHTTTTTYLERAHQLRVAPHLLKRGQAVPVQPHQQRYVSLTIPPGGGRLQVRQASCFFSQQGPVRAT